MEKIRIDQLLVEKNLAPSRTHAQSLIMQGLVLCGTERINKSSEKFLKDAPIVVKGNLHPYVGRGGLKLEKALDYFKVDVTDKTAMDVGVSTGGFTDCLLQRGAKKVIGVDVGYGQIDWKLRNDPRVELFEKTNFRYFDLSLLSKENLPTLVVVDVSFISLTLILPKIAEVFSYTLKVFLDSKLDSKKALKNSLQVIALIKPQFEAATKEEVGEGGIVRDPAVRTRAIERVKSAAKNLGFSEEGVIDSPITGQDGNQEYLISLFFTPKEEKICE